MHKIHTNCISISYCTTLDLIRTYCVIILRHYGVLTDCDRLTVLSSSSSSFITQEAAQNKVTQKMQTHKNSHTNNKTMVVKNDEKHNYKGIKRPVSTAFHIHLTKKRRVWGISMEDFGVLSVWGFCGNSHRIFCGYGMGMGIEI